MFDDTYHTIAAPAEGLYKEKGSKFLAFAYPVHNTDEVKQHLEALRKEYFDARHHCYAYILGPNKDAYRVNDDGEPSGTGGRPRNFAVSDRINGRYCPIIRSQAFASCRASRSCASSCCTSSFISLTPLPIEYAPTPAEPGYRMRFFCSLICFCIRLLSDDLIPV